MPVLLFVCSLHVIGYYTCSNAYPDSSYTHEMGQGKSSVRAGFKKEKELTVSDGTLCWRTSCANGSLDSAKIEVVSWLCDSGDELCEDMLSTRP